MKRTNKNSLLNRLVPYLAVIPLSLLALATSSYLKVAAYVKQVKWRHQPSVNDLCIYYDPARRAIGPIPKVSIGRIRSVQPPRAYVEPIHPRGNVPILLPINRLRYISKQEYSHWEDKIMVAYLYGGRV